MPPKNIPSTLPSPDSSPSSIKITHRTDKSLLMRLMHTFVRPIAPRLLKQKKIYPKGSPLLDVPKSARKHCTVRHETIDDINIYNITAKESAIHSTRPDVTNSSKEAVDEKEVQHKRKKIYYFAGGGWRAPATGDHWAFIIELARKLPDTTVSLVSYPLAPNTAAPIAFPMLQTLYRTIIASARTANETIILAGDSAGGNVALALALAAITEDPKAPLPDALMLLSPSADCRRSNPDIEKVAPYDPILRVPFIKETAHGWRGEWDASDPRVSPLLVPESTMQALAARRMPIHGVTGTHDILAPDAVLFRDACGKVGVQGEWLDWEGQMHVWPIAFRYGLRESREAKDWVVDVLSRC